jgi:hypothetical protein
VFSLAIAGPENTMRDLSSLFAYTPANPLTFVPMSVSKFLATAESVLEQNWGALIETLESFETLY